jgi:hypothetical protein
MASVLLPIVSEFDGKGVDKAIKQFQQLEGAGAKSAFALKKAFVPALAAVAGLAAGLGLATKAAIEDEKSQTLLAQQLKTTTGATDSQIKSTETLISKMQMQYGVADDQLRPALANLVRATGSLELSQTAMANVIDLSVAKNIDLETASTAVSKALAGQTTALFKLDPSLKGVIDSSSSADEIMKALTGTFGGAAQAAADTAAGGFAILQQRLNETKESIGAALLPIIEKLLPVMQQMAEFAQNNTEVFLILAGTVGGVATAIVLVNVGMKLYAATTTLVKIANVVLAGSFTTVKASVAVLGTAVGIVAITLGAFYELFKEGPRAIKETVQPFKDFALFVGATVATIGNGVIDAVQLVVNGINTMVNTAIDALNLLNPFKDIPDVPLVNLPTIPVPSFGSGTYSPPTTGIFAPSTPPKSGGTMPGVSIPTMPELIPAVGGGTGNQNLPKPINGPIGYVGGIQDRIANRPEAVNITVNAGLVSTPAQIGQEIITAIQQAERQSGQVFAAA